jgi:hypothetical protein
MFPAARAAVACGNHGVRHDRRQQLEDKRDGVENRDSFPGDGGTPRTIGVSGFKFKSRRNAAQALTSVNNHHS